MGVVISPESELGKELWKWDHAVNESHPSDPTIRGLRPTTFQAFPKMVYKATKREDGRIECCPPEPQINEFLSLNEYHRAFAKWEAVIRGSQRLVHSEDEHRRAKNDGWCGSPREAIDHQKALDEAVSTAAAEAHFAATRMSEKAQREFRAVDQATSEHIADVTPASLKAAKGK